MLKILKKYPYAIIFLIYFIVNIPILDNLPFGIDYRYWIIDVSTIENPLMSWLPWSNSYKSWPLTYTILWVYLKIFGDSVVLLRVFNLIIHFANFYLLKKIAHHYIPSKKKVWLGSLLFLFTPLATLTISWAFQLKTVLGLFFFLTSILLIITRPPSLKSGILLILGFYLSMTAKILGVLLPLFYIWFHRKNLKNKYVSSLSIFLLTMSLVQGLLNIKGVTYFKAELKQIQADHFSTQRDIDFKMSELEAEDRFVVDRSTNRPVNKVVQEISVSSTEYLESFSSSKNLRDKYIIAIQNLGRLGLYSLGFYNSLPFYEDPAKLLSSDLIFLYSFIGVILLSFMIIKRDDLLLISFLLYIPISGLIYVPYMKHSYTSDHWFYAASGFLILGLLRKIQSPLFWNIATLAVVASFSFNVAKYSSFEGLLSYNFKENQNKVALQTSLFYDKLRGQQSQIMKKSQYILDQIDFNSQKDYYNMINSAAILGNKNLSKAYFSRFAVRRIKNGNELLLDQFLLNSKNFISKRDAVLTKALTAANKNYLSEKEYQSVIEYLKQDSSH
tara:strand:- start:15064 stop:16734 length:1671 start_codon:yes stop_codon:yes gene_type:complete